MNPTASAFMAGGLMRFLGQPKPPRGEPGTLERDTYEGWVSADKNIEKEKK